MSKNSAAGERIAYAKRALEAAEFVDEAAAWAHQLTLDECQRAGEHLVAFDAIASTMPLGSEPLDREFLRRAAWEMAMRTMRPDMGAARAGRQRYLERSPASG